MPATWPNFRGSQLLPCTPLNPANFNWNPHKQATWGTGKVSWTLLRYWLTSPVLNLPLHLLPSTLGMLQGLDHTHHGTEERPKQAKALRCCEEGKIHQRQGALTGMTASPLQKIPGIWGKMSYFKKKIFMTSETSTEESQTPFCPILKRPTIQRPTALEKHSHNCLSETLAKSTNKTQKS